MTTRARRACDNGKGRNSAPAAQKDRATCKPTAAAALLAWLFTQDPPQFPGSLHATQRRAKKPARHRRQAAVSAFACLAAWLVTPGLNMASKTLRQAEKKALEGTNESQDTLAVARLVMREFGVGLVSQSSVQMMAPAAGKPWRNLARPGQADIWCTVQRSSSPPTEEQMSFPSPRRSRPPSERTSKNGEWRFATPIIFFSFPSAPDSCMQT